MSKPTSLTDNQKTVLVLVHRTALRGGWYRAATSGERVTLASLHSHGLLVRRARRGIEGEADAAYEYQTSPIVQQAFAETKAIK
jgi:hypothetical protein